MAKLTYNDLDGTSPQITFGGKTVKSGESFETDDERLIAKAEGNPWFDVTGKKASVEKAEQRQGFEGNTPTDVELADVRKKGAEAFRAGKKVTDVPPVYRGEKNWRAQAWKEGYEDAKNEA